MRSPFHRSVSLFVIASSLSFSALAATSSNVDCGDPAFANLPSCDNRGAPRLPSAADREKRLHQQEVIRCNKAKLACKKKPVAQRDKCLQQVEENIC